MDNLSSQFKMFRCKSPPVLWPLKLHKLETWIEHKPNGSMSSLLTKNKMRTYIANKSWCLPEAIFLVVWKINSSKTCNHPTPEPDFLMGCFLINHEHSRSGLSHLVSVHFAGNISHKPKACHISSKCPWVSIIQSERSFLKCSWRKKRITANQLAGPGTVRFF